MSNMKHPPEYGVPAGPAYEETSPSGIIGLRKMSSEAPVQGVRSHSSERTSESWPMPTSMLQYANLCPCDTFASQSFISAVKGAQSSPVMSARHSVTFCSSTRTKTLEVGFSGRSLLRPAIYLPRRTVR